MIMGSTTIALILLTAAKLLSPLFGKGLYRYLDMRGYTSVMAIYGYFYEIWSGVEVRRISAH